MKIFGKSYAHDAVDRWNYFWSVLFFLLLALITWLVPLGGQGMPKPEFSASCWTPSAFTDSHVNYVNKFCGTAFNDMINKRNRSVVLYAEDFSKPLPLPPVAQNPDVNKTSEDSGNTDATSVDKVNQKAKYPLGLLLFAVVLIIPYVLSDLVSGCLGLLNIDQTLRCAVQAQFLEQTNRQTTFKTLVQSVRTGIMPKRYLITLIFLFVKTLCCAFLIIAIIGVHRVAMSPRQNEPEKVSSESIYACEVSVRMLQTLRRWTMQCLFTAKTDLNKILPQDKESSGFYGVLPRIVLAYLGILFIVNAISLLTWICRIAVGHCNSTVLSAKAKSTAALDLQLLLLLSHDNAGPLVTGELVECLNDWPAAPGEPVQDASPTVPPPSGELETVKVETVTVETVKVDEKEAAA